LFDARGNALPAPNAVAIEDEDGGYYGDFSIDVMSVTADGTVTLLHRHRIGGDLDPSSPGFVADTQCARYHVDATTIARFEATLKEHQPCALAPKPQAIDRDQGGTTFTLRLPGQVCEVRVYRSTKAEGDVGALVHAFATLLPDGFSWREPAVQR
jgi:hypothetical protein